MDLGYIYFRDGLICYASIVNRRDRLGDILVKDGRISQAQLEGAIEEQGRERDKRLGEILVGQGVVSQDDLERYMRIQIEEAVYFLFTWTSGNFNFESGVQPEEQDFLVAISPESLLLEGARRVDEWSLIEKKIPSFDLIFEVDSGKVDDKGDLELTEHQEQVLALLDGKRDVSQVVEETALGEFDVGKALYGLITAGFVHRTGRSSTTARISASASGAQVDEARNLGVAFYKTGMLEESSREFRRVIGLRPTDGSAYFYLGLIALRQARWEESARQFTEALERGGARSSVLYNLGLAYEKSGRLEDAEQAFAEAASKARHDWRILTGWGITALRRGDFEVAAGRLDRAAEVSGDAQLSPLWYWARSLTHAAQEDLSEAEKTLREGLELYDTHPVLRNNLSVVLEILGMDDEVERLLESALAEDPWMAEVSKNLGDLYYRTGRFDEAWEAYQRAAKQQPDLGDDMYFKLGNIAYKRLDSESAAKHWAKALEINPRHGLARTNMETLKALSS
jgi:tetratricopeptide (TPR) repeat protein